MKPFRLKKTVLLCFSALLIHSCNACSASGISNDTNLERAVFSDLVEEIELLNISDEDLNKVRELTESALSETASLDDILNATSYLNEIKNKFLNKPITFVDSALKARICKILGKNENSLITVKEALKIRELDLSYEEDKETNDMSIHYISDLRKFPLIKKLILDGNDIYSLDGLENLTNLTELSLSGCLSSDSASDITLLAQIPNLEILDI